MPKGTTFGEWKAGNARGQGGQAQVFPVTHGTDGRAAVVKLIMSSERAWRAEKEIEALGRLRHPHIPALLGTGTDTKGRHWIVMTDGGRVVAADSLGEFPLRSKLTIFAQIVSAVAHAHEHRVVHRDIKPNNIVVDGPSDTPHASLIDFGICTIQDTASQTTVEAFGNHAFAAPECMLGSQTPPQPASDVYSLGKVLYWLLSNGKFLDREKLKPVEAEFASLPSPVLARVLGILRDTVATEPHDRVDAQRLLNRANTLVAVAQRITNDEAVGRFWLVDNLGPNSDVGWTGSVPIVAPGVTSADIHPHQVVNIGGLPTLAAAQRIEYVTAKGLVLQELDAAFSSLTQTSTVLIEIVPDQDGLPGGTPLERHIIELSRGEGSVFQVPLSATLPADAFWVLFRPAQNGPSYAHLHLASNGLQLGKFTASESTDGGVTWRTPQHATGPGYAISITAVRPLAGDPR